MKKLRNLSLLTLLVVLLVVGVAAFPAGAADHLDAPGLTPPGGDLALDITDVYAFSSPECDGCSTVLVMGVNGLTAGGVQAAFSSDAVYELNIDIDDKNVDPDVTFLVKFSQPDGRGVQKITVDMKNKLHRDAQIIGRNRGRTTAFGAEPVVNTGKHGVAVFAGMRDDPFFFDLQGFLNVLDPTKTFCTSPVDTFAGTNIGAIVIEVPNWLLGSINQVGVWAVTKRDGQQIDRMGRPAINTVFIPNNPLEPSGSEPSQKNAFNAGKPKNDRRDFRSEVVDTLEIFYGAGNATAASLADFLLPDVLTIELGQPTAFPNGRALADDVIDIELNLVTNGAITTDCINGNDKSFSNNFPYLAPPF